MYQALNNRNYYSSKMEGMFDLLIYLNDQCVDLWMYYRSAHYTRFFPSPPKAPKSPKSLNSLLFFFFFLVSIDTSHLAQSTTTMNMEKEDNMDKALSTTNSNADKKIVVPQTTQESNTSYLLFF